MPLALGSLSVHDIAQIRDVVLAGGQVSPMQARELLEVQPGSPEQAALFAAACAVRDAFVGPRVHFCSILNAKAGNCSEDCGYCTQASDSTNDGYKKHKWVEDEDVIEAARSAAANGASAMALVAAWKGVKEGPQLDMVCESVRALAKEGVLRADVNLGILESQHCADRLYEAGVRVYGHNLETARSFFAHTCTTHSFEERWATIQYIKQAGMGLCSGGILGMGESKEQRVEFMEQLRFIEPHMIPVNFLNPLPGTAFADRGTMDPDEALTTLAVMRLFLPDRNIQVAGGKEATFKDRLHEVFGTGINAVMVGNYLTTLGTSPEFWAETLPRYGLRTAGRDGGCGGSGCGCG